MANDGKPTNKGRVTVSYDSGVEGEHPIELPPMIGLLGSYSGHASDADRNGEWIDLDEKNLNRLGDVEVRFKANVPNTLTGVGEIPVDLRLEGPTEVWPVAVADGVEPIRRLKELRAALVDLRARTNTDSSLRSGVARLLGLPEDERAALVASFEACDRED